MKLLNSNNLFSKDGLICSLLMFSSEAIYFITSDMGSLEYEEAFQSASQFINSSVYIAVVPAICIGFIIANIINRTNFQLEKNNILLFALVYASAPVFIYLSTIYIICFLLILITVFIFFTKGILNNPLITIIITLIYLLLTPIFALLLTLVGVYTSYHLLLEYLPYSTTAITIYLIHLRFNSYNKCTK